jgi:hypothetical protein
MNLRDAGFGRVGFHMGAKTWYELGERKLKPDLAGFNMMSA